MIKKRPLLRVQLTPLSPLGLGAPAGQPVAVVAMVLGNGLPFHVSNFTERCIKRQCECALGVVNKGIV